MEIQTVQVERGAALKIVKEVPDYEAHVLRQIHGDANVHVLDTKKASAKDVSVEEEYDRLMRTYPDYFDEGRNALVNPVRETFRDYGALSRYITPQKVAA